MSLTAINFGDTMRWHVQAQTSAGRRISQYIETGGVLPDEFLCEIMADALSKADGGWALCGFPSTVARAELLTRRGHEADFLVELTGEDRDVIEHRALRRICADCHRIWHLFYDPPKQPDVCDGCGGRLFIRPEDEPKTIMRWLNEYRATRLPLIDMYQARNRFIRLDGAGDYRDVADRIRAALPTEPKGRRP